MEKDPSEQIQNLLLANMERIEHSYAQAIRDGIEKPLVLVLNVLDSGGRRMAEMMCGEEEVASRLASVGEGIDLCIISAMTKRELLSRYPTLGRNIRVLDGDHFADKSAFPVVVASGGKIVQTGCRIPNT